MATPGTGNHRLPVSTPLHCYDKPHVSHTPLRKMPHKYSLGLNSVIDVPHP